MKKIFLILTISLVFVFLSGFNEVVASATSNFSISIVSETPVETTVIFRGKAQSRSYVTLLKDAQIVAVTQADPNANFEISLTGLSAGIYSFGLWADDTAGRRTSTYFFNISITEGVTTIISGIFLSPTIAIDQAEVRQGDILNILGQSAPSAQVSVFINSGEEIVKTTGADNDGAWLYKFDTTSVDLGDYSTRVRASKESEISDFSPTASFKVSKKSVKSKKKCPAKGDLNNDCKVNLFDFSIAAYWWKKSLPKKIKKRVDRKLYRDGKINLRDFSVMAYYWTG